MHPTGKVTVFTGSHSHGQGHETTFAQVAADELQLPIEDVEIVHGDTGQVPFGMGSYGSRSGPVGTAAIYMGTQKIKEKAKKIAAHLLEANEADVVYESGKFAVKGTPGRFKTFGDVALMAYLAHNMPKNLEPGLEAISFFDPGNFVFPFGTHVCVVEVTRDTGNVKLVRYLAVDDLGQRDQPDDRGRHGPRRHRAGRLAGALGARRIRRGGPARHRLVHELRDAARGRRALAGSGTHRDAQPGEPARHQGRGRDRHHRLHRLRGQRGDGRALALRDHAPGHAAHAGTHLGSTSRPQSHARNRKPARLRRRRDRSHAPYSARRREGGDTLEEDTMYAASFEYHAPSTLQDALALLGKYGEEAKVLAGSQSLVPLMKLRLAQPAHVVDLRKVDGLTGIREANGALQIGAFTTHAAMASSELVRKRLPMAAEAAALIGDAQVRNLGTIGGSLAHADPSADWPAVMTALDASVVVAGPRGERTIKLEQLIVGPLTTSLQPGEILVQIRVALPPARTAGAYEKLPNPASRFAIVGVAAEVSLDGRGAVAWSRIALTGLGSKVTRAGYVEQALQGKSDAAAVKAAAARAAEGIELREDLIGSPAYKAQLASVYTERAVLRAMARARER